MRAQDANDLDRSMANLELALPHYREAVRIFRVSNHVDGANIALRDIANVEENIRRIGITKAKAETIKAAAARR